MSADLAWRKRARSLGELLKKLLLRARSVWSWRKVGLVGVVLSKSATGRSCVVEVAL